MAERLWCRGCEVSARGESRCWCCGQVMTVRYDPVRTGRTVGSVETRGVSTRALLAEEGPHTPQRIQAEEVARAREAAAERQAAAVAQEAREQVVRTAMRRTLLRSFWAHLAP